MRILLIGTGYVGMALTASWENPSDHFLATTTTASKLEMIASQKSVMKSIILEIKNGTDIEPLLEGCEAVIVTVAPKRGGGYREIYLNTALCLKEGLKKRSEPLFVLYTGSTAVYGNQEGAGVDEESSLACASERSDILSEVEDVFLSCQNDQIQVCILRLGGIYGSMRSLEMRAERVSKKTMNGSGKEVTNHIHLDDITSAIAFCVENRLSGVYNLVNDDHPSRELLYSTLCKKMHLPPPVWEGGDTCSTNATVSNAKIKKAGYLFKQPHVSF
ncbi:MAG: NAD-dependent epimerase/dehydratase family protein [Waddliaceae bacterium]